MFFRPAYLLIFVCISMKLKYITVATLAQD